MSSRDARLKFPRRTRVDELSNESWDDKTQAITTIDAVHKRIHDQKHFKYTTYYADIDDPSGAKFAFFVTGTAEPQHVIPIGGWSAGARIELWEDVTVTGGTGVRGFNSDRNVSDGSLHNLKIYSGIAVYDTTKSGERIHVSYDGAAGFLANMPGGASRENEFILNGNIYYLLWLRPDADNTKGGLGLSWYEEE